MTAQEFRNALTTVLDAQHQTASTSPMTPEALRFLLERLVGKDAPETTVFVLAAAYQEYERLLRQPPVEPIQVAALPLAAVAPVAKDILHPSLRAHLRNAWGAFNTLNDDERIAELAGYAEIDPTRLRNWVTSFHDLEEDETVDVLLLALEHIHQFTLEDALIHLKAALPYATHARFVRYHLFGFITSAEHLARIASYAGVNVKHLTKWLDTGVLDGTINESDMTMLAQVAQVDGYKFFVKVDATGEHRRAVLHKAHYFLRKYFPTWEQQQEVARRMDIGMFWISGWLLNNKLDELKFEFYDKIIAATTSIAYDIQVTALK